MFFSEMKIVATEESKEPPSEQVPPRRKDGLNSELAKYISGMAFKLALTEEEHNVSYLPSTLKNILKSKKKPCLN